MGDDNTEKHSLNHDFMDSERSEVDGAMRHPGKSKCNCNCINIDTLPKLLFVSSCICSAII